MTPALGKLCSIQLSYGGLIFYLLPRSRFVRLVSSRFDTR